MLLVAQNSTVRLLNYTMMNSKHSTCWTFQKLWCLNNAWQALALGSKAGPCSPLLRVPEGQVSFVTWILQSWRWQCYWLVSITALINLLVPCHQTHFCLRLFDLTGHVPHEGCVSYWWCFFWSIMRNNDNYCIHLPTSIPQRKTVYEPWETFSQGSGQMLLGVCTQTGCHLVADGWFEDGGWMTKMDAADISLLVSSLLSNQETTTLWCDIIVHHQAIIYLVHKEAHMLLSSSILLYMTLAEQNLANRFGRSFIMYLYILYIYYVYMYTVVTQSILY